MKKKIEQYTDTIIDGVQLMMQRIEECEKEIEKLQEDKEFRKQLDKLREGQEELRVGQRVIPDKVSVDREFLEDIKNLFDTPTFRDDKFITFYSQAKKYLEDN